MFSDKQKVFHCRPATFYTTTASSFSFFPDILLLHFSLLQHCLWVPRCTQRDSLQYEKNAPSLLTGWRHSVLKQRLVMISAGPLWLHCYFNPVRSCLCRTCREMQPEPLCNRPASGSTVTPSVEKPSKPHIFIVFNWT